MQQGVARLAGAPVMATDPASDAAPAMELMPDESVAATCTLPAWMPPTPSPSMYALTTVLMVLEL